MTLAIQSESNEEKIARLEAELVAERLRADTAVEQLRQVHEAVRSFKQKQEQVARARKAREARARAAEAMQPEPQPTAGEPAVPQPAAPAIAQSSGVAEAWEDSDPSLDERLTKYLENTFEPDRSRDWMLQG